jgi:phosphate transport system substrate-binding protein
VTLTRNRLAALGLVALGAVALSACGSDNLETSAPPANTAGITCASGSLTSSGSTAQANAMSVWIKNYQTACRGAEINYGGGGSGKGYTDFTAGTDDFAGSDYPLSTTQKPDADKRCNGNAIDLPMAPGAIAVGYNLAGVSALRLSAKTLGSIFSGKTTHWNDAAVQADNPGVNLPATTISTFHRSDTSGTSFNFSNYLFHDSRGTWTTAANKQWPSAAGGQGSKGTAGIAQGVSSTPGGIGYMEDSYAVQSKIAVAKIGDKAGNFVELTDQNTTNFLAHATVSGAGSDLALTLDYDATGADIYPNTLVTYEFVCSSGNATAALLKGFLGYTAGAGQSVLSDTGYVPLPSALQAKVQAAVAALT